MAENENDDFDPNSDSADIKDLRRAATSGKQAKAEAEALKRENAFLRAGIDLDDPKMTYFVKGYDGDLDAATIRKTASDAGFIAPPAADPSAQQAADSQQRIAQASLGVTPSDDGSGGLAALQQAYDEGGVPAMLAVAQQYGVPVNTGPIGPASY